LTDKKSKKKNIFLQSIAKLKKGKSARANTTTPSKAALKTIWNWIISVYFPVCGITWHYFYSSLSYKNTAASFLYPPFSIEEYSRESHQFCFNLTCLCRGKKNGQ